MGGKKKQLGTTARRPKRKETKEDPAEMEVLELEEEARQVNTRRKGPSASKTSMGKSKKVLPPPPPPSDDEDPDSQEGEEEEDALSNGEDGDNDQEVGIQISQPKKKGKKSTVVKKKNKSVKLLQEEEILLLDELKKVPALWSSGPDYIHFGKDDKEPLWETLGKPFNLNVQQIRQWYKNIRTQLGKYTDLPPSGSGAVKLTNRAAFIVQHASFIKGEITRIVGRVNTTLKYDRTKMPDLETKLSQQSQLKEVDPPVEILVKQTPMLPSLGNVSADFEVGALHLDPHYVSTKRRALLIDTQRALNISEQEVTAAIGPPDYNVIFHDIPLAQRPKAIEIVENDEDLPGTQPGTSRTPVTARVYPANRTKTAESNRLNDALQEQVRTTVDLQNRLTAWLDKNADIATNERLVFHQFLGQTSLKFEEGQWNNYRREVTAVMEKYLTGAAPPPAVLNMSDWLVGHQTPIISRPPPAPMRPAAAQRTSLFSSMTGPGSVGGSFSSGASVAGPFPVGGTSVAGQFSSGASVAGPFPVGGTSVAGSFSSGVSAVGGSFTVGAGGVGGSYTVGGGGVVGGLDLSTGATPKKPSAEAVSDVDLNDPSIASITQYDRAHAGQDLTALQLMERGLIGEGFHLCHDDDK